MGEGLRAETETGEERRLRPEGKARDWPATSLRLVLTKRQLGHWGE